MRVLWRLCGVLAAALFLFLPSMGAQAGANYSLSGTEQRLVSVAGPWRFQPGDDAAWARPGFDDSQWVLIPGDRRWPIDGRYKGLSGFAWYRFRVEVPADAGPLALEMPQFRTSYQVFADGVLLGPPGRVPLERQTTRGVRMVYRLPAGGTAAHTVRFAVRVWHWKDWATYYGGGPSGPATIGSAALIDQQARFRTVDAAWSQVDQILLTFLEAIAGITTLGLFFLRRKEPEYLWFSLMLLFSAVDRSWYVWTVNHVFGVVAGDAVDNVLTGLSVASGVFFYAKLLQAKRSWGLWVVVCLLLALPCSSLIPNVTVATAAALVVSLPSLLWVAALLVSAARRGLADARLLLAPVLVQQITYLALTLVWLSFTAGWQVKYSLQDVLLSEWPFAFYLRDLTALVYLSAVLAILVGRFARTSREQDRVQADLEAARSLQQVLIPMELPAVPGFAVETAYYPAQEVGGDFFQVVPLGRGETLAVIGDVAGKGLPAAMTVSLLVGAVRTLAETTGAPGEILAGLNRRLMGRGSGFTTAMALRLSESGEVRVANAGHPAPYWNGREVATEAALPLGLVEEAEFPEKTLWMRAGDRLTLLTDGVPEAICRRELFGFERTAVVSMQTAGAIADQAVRFGQADDITVLSLVALG